MAINQQTISTALLTQLNAGTTIQILPEGSSSQPTIGVDYLKEYFLPGDTFHPTLNNSDGELLSGIYQISVYTPKSQFRAYNKEKANDIKQIFPVGEQANGITVDSVSESRLMIDGDFIMTAVSVAFRFTG